MTTTYVHIGVPKTGSTAIQRFLSDRQGELRNHGLLYPESSLRGFGHHDLAFLLDGGYPGWAKPQERSLEDLVVDLRSEVSQCTGDVLLSSEDFYLFPQPERLKGMLDAAGLLKNRRPQIIVYVRRQDDVMISWYNQLVKAQGFAGTFDESVASGRWMGDYDVQLSRWADVFGAEAMEVRRYERWPTPAALLEDFLSVTCPSALGLVSEMHGSVNTSLVRDLLELQRIINAMPLSSIEKRSFHHELMALSIDPRWEFRDHPVVDRAKRLSLLDSFAASNDAVSKRWFDGAVLFDSDQLDGDTADPYPGLDVSTVVEVFTWLLLQRG